ncbi:lactate racemase domain-containing protein [Rubrobacter indicoceani]|uniref:lactate racemase domain-containing protein n=1 Tax=Rubrobacter indicoceani TaxID=2051957 RepID=UPI000E5BC0F8|nr:lactate racemase domain-containing protein [Rubrobacter indicoceani]
MTDGDLPRVVRVRQRFPRPKVGDVEAEIQARCTEERVAGLVKPGMSVAITVGSRGIRGIDVMVRSLVRSLKKLGAKPFIVPAMGSHGGATAEGQKELLAGYGVTEASCGAPVRSSMEVVELGTSPSGVAVYMDRLASEADGVVLLGRIKPHTDFHGEVESGLMKMAAIGLGKHAQALALHAHGVTGIRDYMIEVAEAVLASGRVLFGVAVVENACEEAAIIEAIPADEIRAREPELLGRAAELLPTLPIDDLDVLFVDRLGKDYSGTGMDTNVIGRVRIPGEAEPDSPRIRYVIVGDISESSGGNALGVGLADFTTERLVGKIDAGKTRENVLTSTFVERAKIPLAFASDREALLAAVRCTWGVPADRLRFAHIPNTLEIGELYVSLNLLAELPESRVSVEGEPQDLPFDASGNLKAFGRKRSG